MPINTATATIEDIKAAETSELLQVYNTITGKAVKKFADRASAERLTFKMIGMLAPGEDIRETIMKGKEPAEVKKMVKDKTPKEKEVGKRDVYESKIIKLLIKENPKRPESRAHKKFGILMNFDGKAVKEYKAQEGKFPTLDGESGWPATELRWAIRLELVKLVD